MIAILDVDYRTEGYAIAACVLVNDWTDAVPVEERKARISEVAPYEPGAFYKRELPCLLAVLEPVRDKLTLAVVDGYVWLGDETKPGLGARLHTALGETVPVVGVAKTLFTGAAPVAEVLRGGANVSRPLYVSAVGISLGDVAEKVRQMHGPNRLPDLIKRVDTLCRTAEIEKD